MYTKIRADVPGKVCLTAALDIHDPETMPEGAVKAPQKALGEDLFFFDAENESAYIPANGAFGAVMHIRQAGGSCGKGDTAFTVLHADEVTLVTGVFVGAERLSGRERTAFQVKAAPDYDTAMAAHEPLHQALYGGTEFTIADTETSAEELLLDAYDHGASAELM